MRWFNSEKYCRKFPKKVRTIWTPASKKSVAERIKIEIILPSATSLWRVIVPSAGIKSRQRVAWCGHMEAEAGRGDAVCLTTGTAGALSSLTCACEGEERANEGRQQQQLDLHRGERWSLLLFRLLGRWRGVCGVGGTPSGQRARHRRPRTRRARTEQPLWTG